MKACFDGLIAFQTPDKDILVYRDNNPVLHITATRMFGKAELIQAVREIREMVFKERQAREDGMRLYNAVCPVCGKVNKDLYLEETHGTMECETCGNIVEVLAMEDGTAIPLFTKELCATIVERSRVRC